MDVSRWRTDAATVEAAAANESGAKAKHAHAARMVDLVKLSPWLLDPFVCRTPGVTRGARRTLPLPLACTRRRTPSRERRR